MATNFTLLLRAGNSRLWRVGIGALGCLAGLLTAPAALADGPDVVAVEEVWELTVGDPDPDNSGPQVTAFMSPSGSLAGRYFSFELNHQSVPTFAAGGLNVQVWDNGYASGTVHAAEGQLLNNSGEQVSWTQQLSVEEGVLRFVVHSGSSSTWGNFGDDGALQASAPTDLTNLNGYSVEASLANSGVAFAGNRVQMLKLKKLRVYTADGEHTVHDLDAAVHVLDQ